MPGLLEDTGPALLFCPGDREDRFAKAASAADLAVLDLEDGVAEAAKDAARTAVARFVSGGGRAAVRINVLAGGRGGDDARALAAAGVRVIVVPKTEDPSELDGLADITGAELVASIETARGLLAVERIAAHPAVAAISWGPYDLAADLELRAVRDGQDRLLAPLEQARGRMLFAAASARIIPIDTVTSELNRPQVLQRDAAEGATLGFRGKFAIHPAQVAPIREAFRPPAQEVERSRRMLAAATGQGAFLFEGEMVDAPMLRRARAIVAAAEAAG